MEQKNFRDLLLPAAAIVIISASLVFGSQALKSRTVVRAAPSTPQIQYYR